MDEDWAQHVLDAETAGEQVAPSADPNALTPLGYTPQLGYLSIIADRLLAVRNAVIAGIEGADSPPPFEPLPRPVTTLDLLREQRIRQELMDLDAFILGGPPSAT